MIRQGLGAGERHMNDVINNGGVFNPTGGMITIGENSTRHTIQSDGAIAIGRDAVMGISGETTPTSQGDHSIAIGQDAANAGQEKDSIAIGNQAGGTKIQGESSIAIGNLAGNGEQSGYAVAIGDNAGRPNQGESSIAIGRGAGEDSGGGKSSIAIGRDASAQGTVVGENTIAIGVDAGLGGSGIDSIMIGTKSSCMSGNTPISNSIVLNATGATLSANANNAFHVAPIREISQIYALGYNIDTKEITYNRLSSGTITHQSLPTLVTGDSSYRLEQVIINTNGTNDTKQQPYQYTLIENHIVQDGTTTTKTDVILEKNVLINPSKDILKNISLTPNVGTPNALYASYNVAITGGPDVPTPNINSSIDLFIGHYTRETFNYMNKLSWSASYEYILDLFNKSNGYTTDGIPLLIH